MKVVIAIMLVLGFQGTAREAIQKQYDTYAAAYVKNDVKAMVKILTPDYKIFAADGTSRSLKEYRASLQRRRDTGGKVDRYFVKILKLKVKGSKAEIVSEETSVMLAKDGSELSKSVHQYADSWFKSRGTWRLKQTKTIKEGG